MNIIHVRNIWNKALHNAFTDLVRSIKKHTFLALRETGKFLHDRVNQEEI